jgi:hypothetical protein
MQSRAIARRCPSGSLTVLGHLAQGTTPWAAADWQAQMRHLGRADAEHTELTTGFRVPGVIIDLATRLLPQLGVSVSPARSVRSDGSVHVLACDDLVSGTVDAVAKALVDEGIVGVISPDSALEELRRALPVGQRVSWCLPVSPRVSSSITSSWQNQATSSQDRPLVTANDLAWVCGICTSPSPEPSPASPSSTPDRYRLSSSMCPTRTDHSRSRAVELHACLTRNQEDDATRQSG